VEWASPLPGVRGPPPRALPYFDVSQAAKGSCGHAPAGRGGVPEGWGSPTGPRTTDPSPIPPDPGPRWAAWVRVGGGFAGGAGAGVAPRVRRLLQRRHPRVLAPGRGSAAGEDGRREREGDGEGAKGPGPGVWWRWWGCDHIVFVALALCAQRNGILGIFFRFHAVKGCYVGEGFPVLTNPADVARPKDPPGPPGGVAWPRRHRAPPAPGPSAAAAAAPAIRCPVLFSDDCH